MNDLGIGACITAKHRLPTTVLEFGGYDEPIGLEKLRSQRDPMPSRSRARSSYPRVRRVL